MANLGEVMRDDTFKSHVEELAQLWNGRTSFSSHTVNYTLGGERLDIQLSGSIVPGHEANWAVFRSVMTARPTIAAGLVSQADCVGSFLESSVATGVGVPP